MVSPTARPTALTITLGEQEMVGLWALAGGPAGADADAQVERLGRELLRTALAARLVERGLHPGSSGGSDASAMMAEHAPGRWAALRSLAAVARVRRGALVLLVVATAIALVGGYGLHWSWTGFQQNHQLWDWLHLLLLPVAFGTLPLWLRHAQYMSRARRLTYAGLVIAFGVFVVIGYLVPVGWTGFSGNTLWDWLTLILLPVTLITINTWSKTGRSLKQRHRVLIAAAAVFWVITVIGGYGGSWHWTGYRGNTLWDWLQLLLLPIVFPRILQPAAVAFVSGNVAKRAEEAQQRGAAEAATGAR